MASTSRLMWIQFSRLRLVPSSGRARRRSPRPWRTSRRCLSGGRFGIRGQRKTNVGTKNFSMTLMQQISIPFLYALHLFNVDSLIVQFWSDLDQFIRDLFEPVVLVSSIPAIQDRGKQLLQTGKAIIPGATEKEPHNIHAALEYLIVELPIFVLAQVMAGVTEEHKHQPFKNGAHYTSGGSLSCSQLVERDLLVSTLRYLIHGGAFGKEDKAQLTPMFRNLRHPDNSMAPHPLLETLTCYTSSSDSVSTGPYPSKFLYEKKTRVTQNLTPEEKAFFANDLGFAPHLLNEIALPSKRCTIDSSSSFEVGDVASTVSGPNNGWVISSRSVCHFLPHNAILSLIPLIIIFRGFVRIGGFMTVSTLAGHSKSYFRGTYFEGAGFHDRLKKKLFTESEDMSPWTDCEALVHLVVLHHACDNGCKFNRTCHVHQRCDESCSFSKYSLLHSRSQVFILHDFYSVVG